MQTMRKTETKIFSWVLLLLLLAGLLTGCGTNDQENSADGQRVLRYGSGDYTAINPALYEHGEINALLFAGLTAHNEKNEVVPGLAEDWSFDEKTCTYTFSLRDGLTFHDGEPLPGRADGRDTPHAAERGVSGLYDDWNPAGAFARGRGSGDLRVQSKSGRRGTLSSEGVGHGAEHYHGAL